MSHAVSYTVSVGSLPKPAKDYEIRFAKLFTGGDCQKVILYL